MADTIFGRILRGEAPARFVYQDELAVAFHDAAPQAPVHLLVIPRRALRDLRHATDEDAPLLGHLFRVADRVARDAGLDDYRVVVNSGAGAGQTIFHLHLHVLGGRPFRWPPG